jgi:hypothetical protein
MKSCLREHVLSARLFFGVVAALMHAVDESLANKPERLMMMPNTCRMVLFRKS